ncbi:MAG: hypothetical protein B6244_10840 [Candidatus Cloacimonetes bacterium 4572_55]|nr:MAG: hypothetical protein B6244_10840 [Candidatus Cloacimonetes bacterium 4572_55]
MDLASGTKTHMVHAININRPDWSPDGQWLAFMMNAQIYKVKADGDSLTQLTHEGRNFFPDWGPDGQWIAYDNTDCGGGR